MAVKTPGSLGALQYIIENTFGTTPGNTDFEYAGFMNTMSGNGNAGEEEQYAEGSRIFDTVLYTQRSAGFSANVSLYRDDTAAGYLWKDIVALAYDPENDLDSFTALMRIAADEWVAYTGCKVDTLELSASGVGDKITAALGVKAMRQIPTQASVTAVATALGVTLGDTSTGPSSKRPITYSSYPVATIGGASVTIPSRSFSVKINNHLEEEPGIVGGNAYAAGEGLVPQLCDVELEYDLLSTGAYWDNLKATEDNDTPLFSITHVIGGRTFTSGKCYVDTEDHPSRAQSTYTETVRIHAGSMTVV